MYGVYKLTFLNKIKEKLINQLKTHYSFVIVPNTNKKYFQLRVRKLFLHIFVFLTIVIGIYSLFLTIISQKINTDIDTNVAEIEELSTQDQHQKEYISNLEEQLNAMNEKISELENLETYIKDITGYKEEAEEAEETEN
mgnify:CR=1 FL=1